MNVSMLVCLNFEVGFRSELAKSELMPIFELSALRFFSNYFA